MAFHPKNHDSFSPPNVVMKDKSQRLRGELAHMKRGSEEQRNMRSQTPVCPKGAIAEGNPMKVKIHYLGLVKTYTNKTQDDLTLPEDTPLSGLFEKLAVSLGKPFNPEVYEPAKKEIKQTFMVLLNGIVIDPQEGLNAKLKDGDVVVIMPLVTGG